MIYYKNEDYDFDVIDFIKAYDLNYNKGCIIKYLVRADKKHDTPLLDLIKAQDYLTREIAHLRSQHERT